MSRVDKFLQPLDDIVVVKKVSHTLLPVEVIAEGRRRIAAGESVDDVTRELAQMEVELLGVTDEDEEMGLALFRSAEFDPNQPRDEQGQWSEIGAGKPSSEERSEVLRLYTQSGGTYREVNEGLRAGQDMSSHQTVQVLDDAFKNEAEPVDRDLYRGLAGYDPYELNIADVGAEFTDAGFVSTTTSRSSANKFATHGASEKGKLEGEAVGIVFKISAKDQRALNMTRYSRYGEDERLLNRGTKFRVTSVKIGEPGKSVSAVGLKVIK